MSRLKFLVTIDSLNPELLGGNEICFMPIQLFQVLTLKSPRKKNHLKMSSAEVVCGKYLPNITDELSIEANSVDPEQTAPMLL